MTRYRVYLNIAVFIVASTVMVGWALGNVVSIDRLEDPYELDAEFANAFGIVPNAEVTYLGVSYGSVTSVERRPGGVVIHMKIRKGNDIPRGSTANVLRKSVIGEPYVDFAPPEGADESTPAYRPGDTVPEERTTVPLEFSELLRSADALLASVPPDDVATLLREASVGLQGRAGSLRALAQAGDRLSAALAARSDVLDRLATNNTRLTRVVTEHRASLGRSLTDLRAVADTLERASGDTSVFLDRGAQVLTQLADVVAAHKGDLDCDLKTLEIVTDAANTDQRLKGLTALLQTGPLAFERVWDATDLEPDGRWLRVGLVGQREEAATQYVPPHTLPEPPPVPPCTSPLQAAAVGTRGTGSGGAGGTSGGLPATGGTVPAAAAMAAVVLLLTVRHLRLRSAA